MSTKGKRKLPKVDIYSEDPGLIVDTPPDSDGNSPSEDEDEDTTDSEESEFSGLEEEEDSDDDESVESFEEASGSGEEGSGDESEAASETGEAEEGTSSPVKKSTEPSGQRSTEQPASAPHDEYEYDSSDEEDIRNTVGNIPMEWYKEYEHIGYDLLGKKIGKPKSGGEIDDFLKKMDDPNYWRSVKDKSTGQDVVLADKDVEMLHRLRKGKYVDPNYNPYEPWVDFFTHEKMIHPVTNRPEHKRSFIPSKWEKLKVGRIVHAMKMGWIKPRQEKKEEEEENFYMLWKDDDQSEINKRLRHHIPAPKMDLPGHSESYNPPPEYLFTEEEELAWKMQDKEDRKLNYIPQKHKALRSVPAYNRFINERFERCLDLYLCPRQRKMRMNVDPEDLIPKLPKPKDLQPFPTTQAMVYKGHSGLVRGVSVDPTGQWLVSASSDETVRFWEVATGRCMKTYELGGAVKTVSWNPNASLCLVAAVVDDTVVLINPALGDKLMSSNTDSVIQSYEDQETDTATKNKLQTSWEDYTDQEFTQGYRLKVKHPKPVSQVTWHGKGDYFAVVMPEGGNQSVMIHQLSKRRSQNPFSKPKGLVQCVLFHPVRPFLFVATQRYVRVYNLLKQELTKKLMTNVKWVSSMSVHPGGDNVIIGSYDCRLGWFDLDLSTKPYQMLRHHKKAVRQVCYHKKYPLFASASDDGTVIICHGMVYNDLLQNPLIVPVKILRGHEVSKGLGVLDCVFHPTQPWIFSSGADHTIRLFT